ncbi:MAG: ParB/RepB/Spo0J family partition protein [Elusimicrobiota bacterium]|nr:ParB/RepB/Spo0J family partition protein [Elusimicrobiota bacterium]
MTRKALGRGLSALIPNTPAAASSGSGSITNETGVMRVPIDKVRPNHLQPRRHFAPEALSELAASIKAHGLAQPIVVSYDAVTKTYELIAGERRWRASQLAGMKEVDVVVRAPRDDRHRLALTLIENLQREDLNPVETALGYLRLMKEFGINQTQLADELGKSKQAVSNTLRMLELPEDMQKALIEGRMTEGHGRAILTVSDPDGRKKIFALVLERQPSVRETEALARLAEEGELPAEQDEKPARRPVPKPADLKALEDSLQQALGTKVVIRTRKNPAKGVLNIHFFSLDDFDRIINILKK